MWCTYTKQHEACMRNPRTLTSWQRDTADNLQRPSLHLLRSVEATNGPLGAQAAAAVAVVAAAAAAPRLCLSSTCTRLHLKPPASRAAAAAAVGYTSTGTEQQAATACPPTAAAAAPSLHASDREAALLALCLHLLLPDSRCLQRALNRAVETPETRQTGGLLLLHHSSGCRCCCCCCCCCCRRPSCAARGCCCGEKKDPAEGSSPMQLKCCQPQMIEYRKGVARLQHHKEQVHAGYSR